MLGVSEPAEPSSPMGEVGGALVALVIGDERQRLCEIEGREGQAGAQE